MAVINSTVATREYENIINSSNPAAETFSVTIVASEGILKAGTVLALNTDGKHEVLGAGDGVANAILAEEVDATSEVVATAYRTGHFNANMLVCDTSHTLNSTDKENLRSVGILLSDAIKY